MKILYYYQESYMYLRSVLSLTAICALSSASFAADILTKSEIESFYAQSAEAQLLGENITINFLQEHVHEDAKTTLHMITNMAGMPTQKETRIYDKARLLKETKQGYEIGDLKSSENNVLGIDISEDGKSAKVKSSSYSIVNMNLPTPQGIISLISEQSMLCDDFVVLNAQGVIQAKDGECSVEVNLKPVQN